MLRRMTAALYRGMTSSYAGSMSSLVLTPLRSITHDCSGAMDCMVEAPGHAVGFMQRRIADASPRHWRDGIVESVSVDGWVRVRTLIDDESVSIWNHAHLGSTVATGSPVALHALYNVLAVGAERVNVIVAD